MNVYYQIRSSQLDRSIKGLKEHFRKNSASSGVLYSPAVPIKRKDTPTKKPPKRPGKHPSALLRSGRTPQCPLQARPVHRTQQYPTIPCTGLKSQPDTTGNRIYHKKGELRALMMGKWLSLYICPPPPLEYTLINRLSFLFCLFVDVDGSIHPR